MTKKFKQLFIEGERLYCCDWRYIEAKRKDVYEKTLRGAGANPKFWIVESEGEAGRCVQYGPYKSRTLSEREVTQEFIENLLLKKPR